MKNFKSAFTMIELVFVIVILGILASVAVPKLLISRDDATVSKIRSDIAAIRSGIALRRSENLMRGNVTLPRLGDGFSNILQNPIKEGNSRNGWTFDSDTSFTVCAGGKCAQFRYYRDGNATSNIAAGTFRCEGKNCNIFE